MTTRGERESRVQHIEEMMRTFTWERGVSDKKLAKEWGLAVQSVQDYSAEASKRIRAAVMDPDTVNATVGRALERALAGAVSSGNWNVVAKLSETWAKVSGAGAAERLEVSGALNPTPAQARATMAELFGKVTPRDADGNDTGGTPEGAA